MVGRVEANGDDITISYRKEFDNEKLMDNIKISVHEYNRELKREREGKPEIVFDYETGIIVVKKEKIITQSEIILTPMLPDQTRAYSPHVANIVNRVLYSDVRV